MTTLAKHMFLKQMEEQLFQHARCLNTRNNNICNIAISKTQGIVHVLLSKVAIPYVGITIRAIPGTRAIQLDKPNAKKSKRNHNICMGNHP